MAGCGPVGWVGGMRVAPWGCVAGGVCLEGRVPGGVGAGPGWRPWRWPRVGVLRVDGCRVGWMPGRAVGGCAGGGCWARGEVMAAAPRRGCRVGGCPVGGCRAGRWRVCRCRVGGCRARVEVMAAAPRGVCLVVVCRVGWMPGRAGAGLGPRSWRRLRAGVCRVDGCRAWGEVITAAPRGCCPGGWAPGGWRPGGAGAGRGRAVGACTRGGCGGGRVVSRARVGQAVAARSGVAVGGARPWRVGRPCRAGGKAVADRSAVPVAAR